MLYPLSYGGRCSPQPGRVVRETVRLPPALLALGD
jgi:hypothetical protein